MRAQRWLSIVSGAFVLMSCRESPTESLNLPLSDVTLTVVSGSGQTGSMNQELPLPLVVRVTATNGKPVRGQLLNFRVTSGGGRMYAGAALTDQDGLAQDYWTLGPTPGAQQVDVVAVDGSTGAKQNFGSFTASALAPASLTITPTAAGFGSLTVGASSAPQGFTVRNAGDEISGPVSITRGGTNQADFAVTANSCAGPLVGGASCSFAVTFTPNASGARSATVTASATPGGNASAALTGTGIQTAALQFTPTTFTFGSLTVGQTSNPLTFTVTNSGGVPASGLAVSIAGTNPADFLVTGTNCTGVTLSPGQSCSGAVNFRPQAAGNRAATLVASATGGITATASLSGFGVGAAALAIAPTSVDFGSIVVGVNSTPVNFTVTNSGQSPSAPLSTVIAGTNPTDFAIVNNNCTGATLGPGLSCVVSVRFSPTTTGSRAASLSVSGSGSVSATLTGTGTAGTVVLSIIPASQNFGGVVVGQSTAPLAFTLRNDGATPVTPTMVINGSPAFVKSNDGCSGNSLDPQETCMLFIAFAPSTGGSHTATLSTSVGTTTAALSGTGILPAQLSANPTSVDLGVTPVGTPSRAIRVTITNTGGGASGALSVAIVGTNAAEFSITATTCASTIVAGGASCTIDLVLTPTVPGTRAATLSVIASPGGNLSISLTGTGS